MAACLLLCACRESPVLTETVYQYTAPELDEDEEMLDPEDEGAKDEGFSDEIDDEAEIPREEEEDVGLETQPEEAPPADGAVEFGYNPNAGNEWQSEESPTGAAQDGGGNAEPELSTDEPSGSGAGEGGEAELVAGDKTILKQVVDGAGRMVTLSENVRTVTATWLAAQLVAFWAVTGGLQARTAASSATARCCGRISPAGGRATLVGRGGAHLRRIFRRATGEVALDACFVWSGEDRFSSNEVLSTSYRILGLV